MSAAIGALPFSLMLLAHHLHARVTAGLERVGYCGTRLGCVPNPRCEQTCRTQRPLRSQRRSVGTSLRALRTLRSSVVSTDSFTGRSCGRDRRSASALSLVRLRVVDGELL